ncbi:MAG TPA: right-handed parallel beta-helix repeat-containing protein [Opitutaceae bacterium]|nr:right-handed parallel beta-helix repeat-containing protein [Opitutaceae bacterium]
MSARLFALLLATAALLPVGAAPMEIWVAPDGSDANPGTRAQPLATPARALRQAREARRIAAADSGTPAAAPIRIVLRGGNYALTESLFIRPEDSGTPASPTIIVAAPDETPVLSGGVAIRGWKRAEDEIPGLPAAARGRIWIADTPRFNGRPLEFRQLWIEGQKAIRSRSPNGDGMIPLSGWNRAARIAELPETLAKPARLEGVEMVLLQQWEIAVLRLQSWTVASGKTQVTFSEPESRIEFEHPWPQPVFPPQFRASVFYLTNSIEYLDQPGEWFEDVAAGHVYYWPRDGEDLTRAEVIAPALETLVEIAGTLDRPVTHVRFEGIGFVNTTWLRPSLLGHVPLQAGFFLRDAYGLKPKGTPDSRGLDNQAWIGRPPAAVTVSDAQHVKFSDCGFEHLAANGLDFVTGVQDSGVEDSVFRDVGINGLMAGEFSAEAVEAHLPYQPKEEREVCARLRFANNLLTDCANEDWGGVALIAGSVRDTVIEHNEISNTSYTGISLGWGWTRTPNAACRNTVRANLIHHVATRMSDTAGIYTLSAQPGTLIAENVVRDITMSPWVHDPEHWFYLYTDEGSSFITVRDNWCPAERFLKNANGPGNVWENNGPRVSEKIREAAGRKLKGEG